MIPNNLSLSFDLPSDHALVVGRLSIPRPAPTRVLVNHRNLRNINLESFKESIRLSALLSDPSSDLSTTSLQYDAVLSDILDQHAPKRSRHVTLRPMLPGLMTLLGRPRPQSVAWNVNGVPLV